LIRISDSQDELERMLIGSLLAKGDKYLEVSSVLADQDFLNNLCRQAYNSIAKLYRAGGRIDVPAVAWEMKGDIQWLYGCELVSSEGAMRFAEELAHRGIIRRVQTRMKQLVNTNQWEGSDEITSALRLLYLEEAGAGKQQDGGAASTDKVLEEKIATYRERGCIGVSTGFDAYEQENVFYEPGHMWVIGGWTSSGKTALTVEKLRRLCWDQNAVAAYFSTEMTREQVYSRYLSNITGYGSKMILAGRLAGREAERLADVRKTQVAKGNLYVYDKLRSIDEIEIEAKKIKMRHGRLDVFFIDYLQHLRGGRGKGRREQMVDISARLQDLPKDVEGTGVYLSQLSNTVGREDPGQLEFKEAGEFAADCDIGIQIKRAKNDQRGLMIDMRKNRHGPVFQFAVSFSERWNRIEG
jgi:replicative DNA helicase